MTRFIARHQAGLSYFFLAGFFGCVVGEGLGYLKGGVSDRLTEGVLLILFYWFSRQRQQDQETPPPSQEDPHRR